ncbi:MAG: hypothetical protein SOX32_11705 [Candidatus Choladocola sp.]|nr:hypothetical protein [Candidatus Choladocola sp.]
MISKISFFKLTRDEMKKLSWLTAVQLLVFGLLIPFRVLVVMAASVSDEYLQKNPEEILQSFYRITGFDCPEVTFVILCAGILCALCAFGYVHSSVKLDFYHSLAIRRERLFASKAAGSAMTFAVAYLSSQILSLLVGALYGVTSAGVVLEVAAASLEGILVFLCSYAGALVAVMLTGKMLTTVLAIGVFGLYVPMMELMVIMFREVFLPTFLGSSGWRGRETLSYSSPWAFCLLGSDNTGISGCQGLTGCWPGAGYLCQIVAITVILMLIAVILYRKRKTECAGNALAFRKLEGIIKILLAVPTALLAATAAYEGFCSIGWELVFLVFFGALACVIMEFIYRNDIRQSLRHKWQIAVTVCVSALIFCGFRFDLFGYNSYLPQKEEVTSMAVEHYYGDFIYMIDGKPVKLYDSGDSVNIKKILDYLETENFDELYQLAVNGVESSRQQDPYADTVYAAFKYTTVNGKEIYRNYCVDTKLFCDAMDQILKQQEVREKYFPILGWDDSYIDGISGIYCNLPSLWLSDEGELPGPEDSRTDDADTEEFADEEYEDAEYVDTDSFLSLMVSVSDIDRLLEAYRQDLQEMSFYDCLWPTGTLGFDRRIQGDFTMQTSYEFYPLSPAFTRTLQLLKEIGIPRQSKG